MLLKCVLNVSNSAYFQENYGTCNNFSSAVNQQDFLLYIARMQEVCECLTLNNVEVSVLGGSVLLS